MEIIMISIGGSVIHPDTGINIPFLKGFNELIRKQIAKDRRFFIIVGGGHVGREYQYAAKSISKSITSDDMDWLGVHGTRLNAQLVKTIFKDIAYEKVVTESIQYDRIFNGKKVIIGAGAIPGVSTDFDMMRLSEKKRPKFVICLLNVKQIYDRDPNIFPDAQPLSRMSWSNYREMIGEWWSPERSLPFDPFAAKLAQKMNLKVIFAEGKNLSNLENILDDNKFKGTILD